LLLQVVLQTQIAIDEEEFRMPDVIAGIDAKIKRRHPHVFGDVKVSGAEDVTRNWETIKQAEKEAAGRAEERPSALDGIPRGLPALAEAEAIGGKAARQNFDWRSIDGVLAKVVEEIHELQQVEDEIEREEEFGDVLFALANVARWLKIDPEAALRAANHKFRARFREVERLARERARSLSEMNDRELDDLWNAAKQQIG
jgi:tetrapyrrole methylase family protein/MazG family protein